MEMLIRKLEVKKNGKKIVKLNFKKRLNLVEGSELLSEILMFLTGAGEERRHPFNLEFCAVVEANKVYRIFAVKPAGVPRWQASVAEQESGADCTKEFFDMLCASSEAEAFNYFCNFKRKNYPRRISFYKDLEKHYPGNEFSRLTDGYGCTKCFRRYMRDYIRDFRPIRLCENKEYYLNLTSGGEFCVTDIDGDTSVMLSESETVIYNYLCFLCLADFWSRAEEMRNFNRTQKPLIISSFLERLDSSMDVVEILHKTKALPWQTIIFVPNLAQHTVYNL